jgi:tetratricopeptide (TPR) repeat protein/predicted Ser/Thr protein kinase
MDPERWRKVESIFNRVVDADKSQRESMLEECCAGDEELRGELESLLARADASGGLLDQPAAGLLGESATVGFSQGARLGPFQIQDIIGHGGMGQVYRAIDTRLGRTVAIKTSSADFIKRFEREARAIAALNHPHICQLYDVGPDYLVMEYIEGTPLNGPLPLDEALRYADQICDALEAAHRKGIVHRDLKPGNILLSNYGIKLLDFGLAQIKIGPEDSTVTNLTLRGAVMGTPGYMSPEQWKGVQADARSDIYSFGCLLYELLTGKHAGPLTGVANLASEGSPELRRILVKCLQEDPDQRYQQVSDLRADLLRLRQTSASARAVTNAASGTPGAIARHWKLIVPAAALLMAATVAGYFYHRFHGSTKLTDKDTIVLADFENKTGDAVFDGTLRQGMTVGLEQSPFLSLVSDARIQTTLAFMGQPADARLTPGIAREICERTAGTAVLDGSIAQIGSQYLLTLKAVNCASGESVASTEAQAMDKNHVLDALGKTASEMRNKLGESLSTVQKFDTPLEDATTPSLEALKAFSSGIKVINTAGPDAAIPFFKHAIELDPQFALAYAYLGIMENDIGESSSAVDYQRKAYELRGRASEAEKYSITATYQKEVTGNIEKAIETCQLWIQAYPRAFHPHDLLAGMILPVIGQYEKAVEEATEAIRLNPSFPIPYQQRIFGEIALGRLEEAKATYAQAVQLKFNNPFFYVGLYQIAFLQNDKEGMAQQIAKTSGLLGFEDQILNLEADTAAYSGRLRDARELSRRAMDSAERAGEKEPPVMYAATSGLREAWFGNTDEARRRVTLALGRPPGRDVLYFAALALAYAREDARAQALAGDLDKRFPEDTLVRFNYLPTLRAKLALNKGNAPAAIESLRAAAPYELGASTNCPFGWTPMYPVFVRGEAYLEEHRGNEAAAEFQKILDHPGVVGSDPVGALARLQLARAYVITGDTVKARAAYQNFFTLWKDADPDIPILSRARAEYAKLQLPQAAGH